MERQAAKVVSGLRGDRTKSDILKTNPILKQKSKPGFFIFRSKAANYRLQYTAPPLVGTDAVTGRKIYSAPESILFRNFTYETNDEKKAEFIMTRTAFGLGRDMWLLEDEQATIIKDAGKAFLVQLGAIDAKQLPAELKAQLIEALGADVRNEFVPPAK